MVQDFEFIMVKEEKQLSFYYVVEIRPLKKRILKRQRNFGKIVYKAEQGEKNEKI
jgi:hypothetical protein